MKDSSGSMWVANFKDVISVLVLRSTPYSVVPHTSPPPPGDRKKAHKVIHRVYGIEGLLAIRNQFSW